MIPPILEFLSTKIVSTNYIFLDIWSIIHFFSGAIITFILSKKTYQTIIIGKKEIPISSGLGNGTIILFTFTLLMSYEFIEPSIALLGPYIESKLNILSDLIMGMSGCFAMIIKKNRKKC